MIKCELCEYKCNGEDFVFKFNLEGVPYRWDFCKEHIRMFINKILPEWKVDVKQIKEEGMKVGQRIKQRA